MSLSAFAHPREVMRTFLREKRIPYPMVGWYVMRHVQQVIGTSFDAIAPVNTISSVTCPVLVVHGRADTVASSGDAERIAAAGAHARLLLVNGAHDLRDALAPHSTDIVEFLRAACAADSPTPAEVA